MQQLFLIFNATLFAILFVRERRLALGIFAAVLPIYLVRYTFGPLPTTLLEILALIVIIGSLISYRQTLTKELKQFTTKHYTLFIAIALVIFGASVGILMSVDMRAALGEWKAFYIEPILIFAALIIPLREAKNRNAIVTGLLVSSALTGILTLIQRLTGWSVPYAFWENGASYRVTGWWGFPNGVGTFQAPLALLWLYPLTREWKNNTPVIASLRNEGVAIFLQKRYITILYSLGFLLTLSSVIFAKSTGGLVGITAGIGALMLYTKRTRKPAITLGIVSLLLITLLPTNPIKTELLAQDRSGRIRQHIWGGAVELLSESPVLGVGLASFDERIEPYHGLFEGRPIEIFHHPHNQVLTFWLSIGLVGMIGMVWTFVWALRVTIVRAKTGDHSAHETVFIFSLLLCIFVQGLVDSPYIKNDIAMMYWILLALLLSAKMPTLSTHYELVE